MSLNDTDIEYIRSLDPKEAAKNIVYREEDGEHYTGKVIINSEMLRDPRLVNEDGSIGGGG